MKFILKKNKDLFNKGVQGEISRFYNTFDTVVKHKYEIRDKVENI